MIINSKKSRQKLAQSHKTKTKKRQTRLSYTIQAYKKIKKNPKCKLYQVKQDK